MRDAGTKFLAEIPDPRDIYTDNSPEALVRRAAFNKGLRYRRNYGGHGIQVAFVAHRVAVFVQPQDYDDSVDDALRSEGWTVLRYSEESITDGSVQGEEILATVRQAEKQRARQKGKSAS
jgi:colicin import membrane protein